MNDDSTLSSVVLPVPVPPEIDDVEPAAHAGVEEVRDLRRQRAEVDEVVDRVRVLGELAGW